MHRDRRTRPGPDGERARAAGRDARDVSSMPATTRPAEHRAREIQAPAAQPAHARGTPHAHARETRAACRRAGARDRQPDAEREHRIALGHGRRRRSARRSSRPCLRRHPVPGSSSSGCLPRRRRTPRSACRRTGRARTRRRRSCRSHRPSSRRPSPRSIQRSRGRAHRCSRRAAEGVRAILLRLLRFLRRLRAFRAAAVPRHSRRPTARRWSGCARARPHGPCLRRGRRRTRSCRPG